MVLDDRQMKVCEIIETIGISKECVGYILHELDMKKLCARGVLHCSQQIKSALA
jgi:DNA-binding transcriptional regulator GbsR (MarR family)